MTCLTSENTWIIPCSSSLGGRGGGGGGGGVPVFQKRMIS